MSKTVTEINKLNKAVNSFQEEMKSTLALKAAQGKYGWNTLSSEELLVLIQKNVFKMEKIAYQPKQVTDEGVGFTYEQKTENCIDVANLAMFYRIALQEGR